jgi:hypothetical protein
MKAYKIEVLVIDFEEVGEEGIKEMIECAHYPNHCISPDVKSIVEKDIRDKYIVNKYILN